jgi:hypothetical protein
LQLSPYIYSANYVNFFLSGGLKALGNARGFLRAGGASIHEAYYPVDHDAQDVQRVQSLEQSASALYTVPLQVQGEALNHHITANNENSNNVNPTYA